MDVQWTAKFRFTKRLKDEGTKRLYHIGSKMSLTSPAVLLFFDRF